MRTLGLISIIFAAIGAPTIAAADPKPRRGLRRMLLFLVAFNALYVAYLTLFHATWFAPTRW